MTIWTVTAKNLDDSDAALPDFDDGGDHSKLNAHLLEIAPNYLSTKAVPQTPVIEGGP
jgi:hypothetical protein